MLPISGRDDGFHALGDFFEYGVVVLVFGDVLFHRAEIIGQHLAFVPGYVLVGFPIEIWVKNRNDLYLAAGRFFELLQAFFIGNIIDAEEWYRQVGFPDLFERLLPVAGGAEQFRLVDDPHQSDPGIPCKMPVDLCIQLQVFFLVGIREEYFFGVAIACREAKYRAYLCQIKYPESGIPAGSLR